MMDAHRLSARVRERSQRRVHKLSSKEPHRPLKFGRSIPTVSTSLKTSEGLVDLSHGLVTRSSVMIRPSLESSTHATTIPCRVLFARSCSRVSRQTHHDRGRATRRERSRLRKWMRLDQIDRGERPGITTPETAELAKAKKRIRQFETEIEILKIAAKLAGEDRPSPKRFTR